VLQTDVTRRLLNAASAAGVRHLVVLSTATVYGAWPNNPVPITEDAPLRPVPDFAYAVGHAEVEQLVVRTLNVPATVRDRAKLAFGR